MQDFDMEVYLQKLLAACQQAFGADLLYMGLQGSWRRPTLIAAPFWVLMAAR